MKRFVTFLVLFFFVVYISDARPARVTQIPNGTKFGCANCHVSASGGGALNLFGTDVNATLVEGKVDWSNTEFAFKDSDGDKWPNAMELSDPMGEWRIGDPNPGNIDEVSNPGDDQSVPDIGSVSNDFTNSEIFVSYTENSVAINFNLEGNQDVQISIFDIQGNQVWDKYVKNFSLTGSVDWERQCNSSVSRGVYFIYIRVGAKEAIRKVVL